MTLSLTLIILQYEIWVYTSFLYPDEWQRHRKRFILKFLFKTYIAHIFGLCELYFVLNSWLHFWKRFPSFKCVIYLPFFQIALINFSKRSSICISCQFYVTLGINVQTHIHSNRYIYAYQYRWHIGKSFMKKISMYALNRTSRKPDIKRNQVFAIEMISPSLIWKFWQV